MKTKTILIAIIIVLVAFAAKTLLESPKPEITYGEFPFRLEYEINGERKVIQDTLICEYDGIGWDEGQGTHREWKEHLASGKEDVVLLEITNPGYHGDKRIVKQEIVYPIGSARYYMGDLDEYESYGECFPDACYYEEYEGGGSGGPVILADDLFKKYHIKLISWHCSKPLKNKFPPIEE